MEIIKNDYHKIVISKLLNCNKFKGLRQGDKVLKAVQIFPEYLDHLNNADFILDILTLSMNPLEHNKLEDQE